MAAEHQAFAIWVTGLPASGKSSVVKCLAEQLGSLGVDAAVLESDVLRNVLAPEAGYGAKDREVFYHAVAWIGALLTKHGVPVIFDATANLRRYRDHARSLIPKMLEVYVDTPLEVCESRDPKGIYAAAKEGRAATVPGLQAAYEPPEAPEVVIHGDRETPVTGARRIVDALRRANFLSANGSRPATNLDLGGWT